MRHEDETGRYWFTQEGGEKVRAVPYDVPIVGYGTKKINRLRLWSAEPYEENFDLDAFNAGDYAKANKFRSDVEANLRKSDSKESFGDAIQIVGQNCTNCHETFRFKR